MADLGIVRDLQLVLFSLMLVGWLLGKLKLVEAPGRKTLTDLLINVILPANIIQSFKMEMNRAILVSVALILLSALGVQLLSYLLSRCLYRRVEPGRRSVLRYATICSNAGFMGNPVVEGIYGADGLMYGSIYLIPLRFFMWTAGLACFTETSLRKSFKKLLVHPCILAVWAGFGLMASQLQLPGFADKTLSALSACTLPVSILIIGTILSEVDIRSVLSGTTLYFCFVRLILIPGLVLVLSKLLGFGSLVTGVSVILSGMPAGSTTAILAEKYGGDSVYASKCVFLSTALSLITIPLLCYAVTFV